MSRKLLFDNPVLRHTGRLTSPVTLVGLVLGTLLLVGIGVGVLQQYWVNYPVDADRPRLYVRWFTLFVLAEVFIVLPWSAIRGAAGWRWLELDGHLEEYRRTRLHPLAISAGALWGALKPVVVFLAVASGVGVLASVGRASEDAPTLLQTLEAHALLLTLALFFAALGQLFAGWARSPALAVPLCLGWLAAATGAIALLNPYYPDLGQPDVWIWRALLPNPAAAVGTLLGIDVLRVGWIYDHVRAQDYFSIGFMYPLPGYTAALYLGLALAAVSVNAARLARRSD